MCMDWNNDFKDLKLFSIKTLILGFTLTTPCEGNPFFSKLGGEMFKELSKRKAIHRLEKLAFRSLTYKDFEHQVINHTSWYLRTPDLRKWTKDILEEFYEVKKRVQQRGW